MSRDTEDKKVSKKKKVREQRQRKLLSQQDIQALSKKLGVSYAEANRRMLNKFLRGG